MLVAGGATNVTTYFAMRLTADGKAATGLTPADFDLQYVRSGVAPSAKVDATALGATDSNHADNKAIEIDATDQPGLYRIDWPDAAFAAGVREVILSVKVATAFTEHIRVEIDANVTAEALGAQAKADVNGEADSALADYNGPTSAELVTEIDSVQTDIAALNNITAASVWAVATRVLTAGTNLNDISVADILTTAMTEAYAANGVAPTMAQLLFAVHQMLMDFSISGTTLTVEQLDGTTAFTVTLNDATNPTAANRS